MILRSSCYLTAYVPYAHLLPEYRPQVDVSSLYEDDPKFVACCVYCENLPAFNFRELPHHPPETNAPILNGPTSRNPVDLNQMSVEARQLVQLFLSTDQEYFDSGTCGLLI
jgi:hypothetical protein